MTILPFDIQTDRRLRCDDARPSLAAPHLDRAFRPAAGWRRFAGRTAEIAVGIGTHLLFAVTVWKLYWFLKGPDRPGVGSGHIALDLLLAVQFALLHSLLLHPAIRRRLTPIIRPAFYGCFCCIATCCTLLSLFAYWDFDQRIIWSADGAVRSVIEAAFLASWAALFYSLSLTGLGYQTGWTPWWRWVRRLPPANRPFQPRGAYLWLRHPVYLSFLGLIWLTPLMTVDRLALGFVWTSYIFIGSWLKDRRLLFYLGDAYRRYEAEVPGYWGISIGPLARIPLAASTVEKTAPSGHVASLPLARKAA